MACRCFSEKASSGISVCGGDGGIESSSDSESDSCRSSGGCDAVRVSARSSS